MDQAGGGQGITVVMRYDRNQETINPHVARRLRVSASGAILMTWVGKAFSSGARGSVSCGQSLCG